MLKEILTIEDCLEILAGTYYKFVAQIEILPTDYTIMSSIARQVSRGIALTDKQYEICKSKLLENYKAQFTDIDCDLEQVVERLRQPLRYIDRRKYIKIATDQEKDAFPVENEKKLGWFVIRFPFSKKMIVDLESSIIDRKHYWHPKGSHEHFFLINESNILNVIDTFKQKEFEIEKELLEFYDKIIDIKNNPKDYIPCISDAQMYNVSSKIKTAALNEIGPLTDESLLLYVDRARRYGIAKVEHNIQQPRTLFEKIAIRNKLEYLSKPKEENINDLVSAINKLNRYPLLVVVQESSAETQLYELFNVFRHVVDPKEQSVLFRLSGDTGLSFNQYIKENNLNNWVDKSTKIVYINNSKLPKLLVKGEWKPITALVFDSYPTKFIDAYIASNCDLVIYRDEQMSPFKKYYNARM